MFTVQLDYGAGIFTGEARWLEIGIACGTDTSFTTLTPRQLLSATPYATYASDAGSLEGQPSSAFASAGHAHWGANWSGTGTGLILSGGETGLSASGTAYGVSASVGSPSGYAGHFTSATGNGVAIDVPADQVGLNVASGLAQVAGNTLWHAGNDGADSGLDADTLDGRHGSEYRVGRPIFSLTTVDSSPGVGGLTSIAIGTDGMGLISYRDATNGDLKIAHCSNRLCIPFFRQR